MKYSQINFNKPQSTFPTQKDCSYRNLVRNWVMSLLTERNSCVLQHAEEPSSEESRAARSSPDLFHHDTHSINNPTSPSHYSRCSLIFWKPVPNFVPISVTFQKPVAISASQLYVKGMLWWQVYSEISPVSRL